MNLFLRLEYPSKQFSHAVRILAVYPGDVRSRLDVAFGELMHVDANRLPKELQEDYRWIYSMLTRHEEIYRGEGRVAASLRRMRNSTGAKIAERIYRLHEEIESMINEDRPTAEVPIE